MRQRIKLLLPALLLLAFSPARLQAVPQLPGLPKQEGMSCRLNRDALQARAVARGKFAPVPPISASTYSVAVIRVDFSDLTMTKTLAETGTFFENMKAFYLENSYSLVTVSATVTNGGAGAQGTYRMPRPHSFYAAGLNSQYVTLAKEAIAVATTAGFNFAPYDHIMLYHAGEGAETSATPNSYIWSVYMPRDFAGLGGPVASGKTFSGLTFVPEKEFFSVDPLGVICHEYGHQLGLPDLYQTPSQSAVGSWSLMDAGVYIGSPQGSKPAHLDAWSKYFLGFSAPETLSLTQAETRTLSQAELSRVSFFRLPISVSDVGGANEYFLLEYRRTSGATYDTALPGQGLLIWHVDDSIASNPTRLANNDINSSALRRGVDLVEGDASDPSSNGGDATDPWPGTTITFTSPKSNAYNGTASGIEITNISAGGPATIAMTIKNPLSNPALTASTGAGAVVVTGGANGYANPSLGESTLIGVRPTQTGRVEVKVYTLTGELVWENGFAGSANQQTVVSWDGRNSDGNTVTTGIYLVHVSGAGVDTKKKCAIAK